MGNPLKLLEELQNRPGWAQEAQETMQQWAHQIREGLATQQMLQSEPFQLLRQRLLRELEALNAEILTGDVDATKYVELRIRRDEKLRVLSIFVEPDIIIKDIERQILEQRG